MKIFSSLTVAAIEKTVANPKEIAILKKIEKANEKVEDLEDKINDIETYTPRRESLTQRKYKAQEQRKVLRERAIKITRVTAEDFSNIEQIYQIVPKYYSNEGDFELSGYY